MRADFDERYFPGLGKSSTIPDSPGLTSAPSGDDEHPVPPPPPLPPAPAPDLGGDDDDKEDIK